MLGDAQRRVAEANEMAAAELAARVSEQEQGRAMLEKAKSARAEGQSLVSREKTPRPLGQMTDSRFIVIDLPSGADKVPGLYDLLAHGAGERSSW